MDLTPTALGTATVVAVTGRVDHENSQAFETALVAIIKKGGAVVLDFSGVTYISSVGLRALMMGAREAKAAGGTLSIVECLPVVKEIFEISRFHFVVKLYASLRDALTVVAPDAVPLLG